MKQMDLRLMMEVLVTDDDNKVLGKIVTSSCGSDKEK